MKLEATDIAESQMKLEATDIAESSKHRQVSKMVSVNL